MAENKIRKNTSAFNNTIKDFEIIRKYLRKLLMDGSYTKADFEREFGISSSSFRDMFARIENYLEVGHLSTHTLPGKTGKDNKIAYHMKGNPFQSPVHYLADIFLNASYKPEDMQFYFAFLMAIGECDPDDEDYYGNLGFRDSDQPDDVMKEATMDELIDTMDMIMLNNMSELGIEDRNAFFRDNHSVNTIKSYISKLQMQGYIRKGYAVLDEMSDSEVKTAVLSPANDLGMIPEDLLRKLYRLVTFFYHITPLCVPGFYLARNIKEYLDTRYPEDYEVAGTFHIKQKNPYFQFYHSSRQNILDDDIVWRMLECIHEIKPVTVRYDAPRVCREITLLPAKIVINYADGRQYVWGYDYESKHYHNLRLDYLSYPKVSSLPKSEWYGFLDDAPDEIAARCRLEEVYQDFTRYSWTVNDFGHNEPADVLIHFTFPEDHFASLKARVMREKRHGEVIDLGDGSHIDFRIKITDGMTDDGILPVSIVPWIRSFGEYAFVDKDVCPALYNRMAREKDILNDDEETQPQKDYIESSKSASATNSSDFTYLSLFNSFHNKDWLWLRNYINMCISCEENGFDNAAMSSDEIKKDLTGGGLKSREQQISDESLDAILNDSVNCTAGNDENLYILSENDDNLLRPLTYDDGYGRQMLPVLISSQEKAWLNYILQDPKAVLFLNDSEIQFIRDIFDDDDTLPISPEYFVCRYPTEPETIYSKELIANFNMIMDSIDEECYLQVTNTPFGKSPITSTVIPVRLIYNTKKSLFSFSAYVPEEDRAVRMNLSRISDIRMMNKIPKEKLSLKSSFESKYVDEPIVISIRNINNAFERAAYIFSDYNTSSVRTNTGYEMSIFYYTPEKNEILADILSLGESVYVISPREIKEEICNQREKIRNMYK